METYSGTHLLPSDTILPGKIRIQTGGLFHSKQPRPRIEGTDGQ